MLSVPCPGRASGLPPSGAVPGSVSFRVQSCSFSFLVSKERPSGTGVIPDGRRVGIALLVGDGAGIRHSPDWYCSNTNQGQCWYQKLSAKSSAVDRSSSAGAGSVCMGAEDCAAAMGANGFSIKVTADAVQTENLGIDLTDDVCDAYASIVQNCSIRR